MDRIDEIRERAEAARPGPWVRNKHRGDLDMVRQEHWTGCEDPGHDDCAIAQVTSPDVALVRLGHPEYDAKPNAEFIAHAREDIPYLLERIDELKRRKPYVVLDVGCLECEIPTSVIGIYENGDEARRVASARAREHEEDGELSFPDPYPDLPNKPHTAIALANCWDNQSSVEVHRVNVPAPGRSEG